ncbi:ubiquitin-conjugating enzyme E2 7 [Cucumis melo var. makuwa]|uniref:Ubiquitin-conjugating enzyme E2 7 n=2 Tax=Cucumis melo TaxID=3656 RepID=A0A5A7VL72_CUCMM|nr:ubiquitin-conjugating enzyme E2 7 [Cucumis melo var. makuwa]TYK21084.1 ubiquitin-conjugating enzyme E2 7 [Cucumis melo var. makuwa]
MQKNLTPRPRLQPHAVVRPSTIRLSNSTLNLICKCCQPSLNVIRHRQSSSIVRLWNYSPTIGDISSDLYKNPVDGFSAGLVDESNIFEWSIKIIGPPDTL